MPTHPVMTLMAGVLIACATAACSVKPVDYTQLETYLKAKQWREADEETSRVMLQVANRESEGWLDPDSIKGTSINPHFSPSSVEKRSLDQISV